MNIEQFYKEASKFAESLPSKESEKLMSILDSLEDSSITEWQLELESYLQILVSQGVGDSLKVNELLLVLNTTGPVSINPIYFGVALVVVVLLVIVASA